jgi:hypothetical protein
MDELLPFLLLVGIAAIEKVLIVWMYVRVRRKRDFNWPLRPSEFIRVWQLHRSLYPNSFLTVLVAVGFLTFVISSVAFIALALRSPDTGY